MAPANPSVTAGDPMRAGAELELIAIAEAAPSSGT